MYNGGKVIPGAHLPVQKLKSPEPSSLHSQSCQGAELHPMLKQLDLLLGLRVWNNIWTFESFPSYRERRVAGQSASRQASLLLPQSCAVVPTAQSSWVLFGSCPFPKLFQQPVSKPENLPISHRGIQFPFLPLNSHLLSNQSLYNQDPLYLDLLWQAIQPPKGLSSSGYILHAKDYQAFFLPLPPSHLSFVFLLKISAVQFLIWKSTAC